MMHNKWVSSKPLMMRKNATPSGLSLSKDFKYRFRRVRPVSFLLTNMFAGDHVISRRICMGRIEESSSL
jgi:hypothetical protein